MRAARTWPESTASSERTRCRSLALGLREYGEPGPIRHERD
jgi:hypothetical protein